MVKPSQEVNALLKTKKSQPLENGIFADKLLKRPELSYKDLETLVPGSEHLPDRVKEQVEIQTKYEGYLQRQEIEVNKFRDLEYVKIPPDFSYEDISGLSNELRQRLQKVSPRSLGQASRIPGITPAALSLLRVYLQAQKEGKLRS